jgi:serine/threonine-protein kinase
MIGVRLGPWIIDQEIGRGGMGTVYKAHRVADAPRGPMIAAVKVLAAELAVEVGFQQRFQREIDILRQLDHPNIVCFYDSGAQDGRYYYAMEFIAGESFDYLRDDRGRVSWMEVLDLAWQISPALKHAHDRGIIHRDLKPSNLLRITHSHNPDEVGVIKLTDFGIASLFASPHLTVTGGVIGTPEFLSPEQAAGKPVTRRSDLYSLGVVLYTLVTGKTPFTGEPVDLLHKHRFGQFDRPSRLVPDLPADLDELICNLLEKDPAQRPADAGVLFRRLDSIRKKLARQTAMAELSGGETAAETAGFGHEGPATMVSRFVRQELDNLDHGGPIQRFFNKPAVLVVMFILCVSTIVYTFWPMSAEGYFQRGAALMASKNPDDWETAWERFLTPLEAKFPDHTHKEELEEFRLRLRKAQAERKAARAGKEVRLSEAQWFYERAMRLRQRGEEEEAKRLLEAVVAVFGDVPEEAVWVQRAQRQLKKPPAERDGRHLEAVREALDRARALEQDGKKDESKAIRRGLAELYRGDRAAERLLKE